MRGYGCPRCNDNHHKGYGMKPVKIFFLVLLFSVVFLATVLFFLYYRKTHITTDDAYVQGHVHWISPRVEGTVTNVSVDDNQLVKEEQVLFALDPETYEASLDQAKAAFSLAEWKLKEAEVNYKAAQADLLLTQAQLEQAKRDLNRAEALLKKAVVPQEKYDNALTNYKVNEARFTVATERVKQAKIMIDTARANVENQKAQLNSALLNVQYTIIKAPIAGYITGKSVEVGQRVKPGISLLALVPLDDVWIEANYKETQLKRIKVGQQVIITVDTYSGKKFYGKVESIQTGSGSVFSLFPPENATGNWVKVVQRIPVKIVLERGKNPNSPLRVGMSVITTVLANN